MDRTGELDRRGRALLARLAVSPDDLDCARQFDTLYYEIVWLYLRANHVVLGARVARYLGLPGSLAPQILNEEIDEVAHDATATALRRVRQNASKFDAAKGSSTRWTIGNAEYAYIEVAKEVVSARRSDTLAFVDPISLVEEPDRNPTTEEHVIRGLGDADALADAAQHLSEREFAALRLRVTAGYSRSETAERIFGDATMKKQVDGLVERAKGKLAHAWSERKPAPRIAGSTTLSEHADEREGHDG